MSIVDIGGRGLFYERRGSGSRDPILLIQGMAGHHGLWGEHLLGGLAADFDVISYDHRGVGESTDLPGPFTIADLADDAAALLDALDVASAHVFGHSMGGMVAQELVLRHPRRVRSLVLGSTFAGGPEADLQSPGAMQMYQAMQSGDLETAIRASYAANLSATYCADEDHYPPFKQAATSVVIRVPLILRQAQAALGHDTSARLNLVAVPTLVIHGTDDRMVRYDNAGHLVRLIPGSRLHSFDGVGHLFWWERPDESLNLVIDHCRDASVQRSVPPS